MSRRSAAAQPKPTASVIVVAKGVLCAYALSIAIFLIGSALIQYTALTEAILPFTAMATSLIAIFVGAAYVARSLKTRGWLNGGITGLVYLLGLVILGRIFLPEFSLDMGYAAKTALAFATGAAGGIFGLNS